MTDPSLAAAEEAAAMADEAIAGAKTLSSAALAEARRYIGRDDPLGRDVSIATTHIEDAILRLRHGSPR